MRAINSARERTALAIPQTPENPGHAGTACQPDCLTASVRQTHLGEPHTWAN